MVAADCGNKQWWGQAKMNVCVHTCRRYEESVYILERV